MIIIKKPLIIAIAALSGGGKTTIVNELVKRLSSSRAIYFDNYVFENNPEDFFEWVQNGADYNAWNLDKLENDIKLSLEQDNISYLLLDYPFAYKNDMIAPYIDCAFFIDTPLDMAMARRILRDLLQESPEAIKNDLISYLSKGRVAYMEMLKTIKPNSNYIIDGNLPIEIIVNEITDQISKL